MSLRLLHEILKHILGGKRHVMFRVYLGVSRFLDLTIGERNLDIIVLHDLDFVSFLSGRS